MLFSNLRVKAPLIIIIILFGLIIANLSALPVGATESLQTVTMAVTPAFQGNFKYGEWLPIWVNLENNGADIEGEIQVSVQQDFNQITYAVPISLANGSRKRVAVYVLPNNFTRELKISLVVGDVIKQFQTAKVQPQPNINYLIGLVTRERGALSLIPGIQLPGGRLPVLLDLSLDTLPERYEGLRSLDCLILNDIDTSSLSPDQISALTSWVQQGGQLVIGGGAGAIQTASGLPNDIIPIQPNDIADLESVDNLAIFSNTSPILVPGPFPVATGTQLMGMTSAEQEDLPLIIETPIGEGATYFVALDLSTSPFDAWAGTTAFWEAIITPRAAYPNWMPPDMSPRQMASGPINNALSNIPSLDLPSATSLVVLLTIYILLVGPINYLILRWRKKLHYAWITIPLITLVFTGLSFGIGYAKRGTDLIVNKIAIIRDQPGSSAQVTSYVGLFSPANQGYEIQINGLNLLSPMYGYYDPWSSGSTGTGNLTFVQGNPSAVRGLTVNQWSMQSFMTETTLLNNMEIQSELSISNGRLEGTVTNMTDLQLNDVIIMMRPNFARLGDIPVGESVQVNFNIDNLQDMMYGPSMSWKIYESQLSQPTFGPAQRQIEFQRSVLEAVLDQQYYYGGGFSVGESRSAKELDKMPSVTILAWLDEAPPDVQVNGVVPQQNANGLFLVETSFKLPESGVVNIPAGLLPGLVAEMPFNGGTCGSGTTSIWMDQGEGILEFIIPSEMGTIQVENLKYVLQSDSGFINPPQVEIYHWKAEDWQSLDQSILGVNIIRNASNYVSDDRLIRFRLGLENKTFQGGGCYYVALGLEGKLN